MRMSFMFKCEQCGPINCAYLDGYRVGDRLLEGVTFIIRHTGFEGLTAPLSPNYYTAVDLVQMILESFDIYW